MKWLRKLVANIYYFLYRSGIRLLPPKFLFHQPDYSLPYTYLETLHADINFTFGERQLIWQAARI